MSDTLLEATRAAIHADRTREAGALFVDVINRYLSASEHAEAPVSTTRTPEDIAARFAAAPPARGRPLSEVASRLVRDVMSDSLRVLHPGYLGPPVASPLPVTIWGEAVIGAMNQSLRAFVMSPTGTPLETALVRWLAARFGYGERAGGTFTSGATESNFSALCAARAACIPAVAEDGVGADPPWVVCGENVDFSVPKAVAELGLGRKQLVLVPLRAWRIDTDALAARLSELLRSGRRVMAVVASAGTYGTGCFDDLETIGALCDAHGLWLHVDAAHGGTAILSERQRQRLRGIERARSIAWDPHKTMMLPLQTGALFVKDERDLDRAFALRGPAREPEARSWDQARRSFLNSRRVDALKVWLAFERYGVDGIGALYDHLCAMAALLHQLVCTRDDFEPLHTPECNFFCFRYVGDRSHDAAALDALNLRIHQEAERSGRAWMNAAVLDGKFVLKVAMANPEIDPARVRGLIDTIADIGRRCAVE